MRCNQLLLAALLPSACSVDYNLDRTDPVLVLGESDGHHLEVARLQGNEVVDLCADGWVDWLAEYSFLTAR